MKGVLTLSLSTYQRATLQAMDVPLFEHRVFPLGPADLDSEKSTILVSKPSTLKNTAAKSLEAISAVLNIKADAGSELISPKSIDENHLLVAHVLDILDVKSVSELGIGWLLHDKTSVVLKDGVLLSVHPDELNTPELKKQLWFALQGFFKAGAWS
jgi:hypothetical protein